MKDISLLLEKVMSTINHNKEIIKIKGESFNIFSILKIETAENSTHSAFIGELLNPNGSHQKSDKFLRLFLEIIGYDKEIDFHNVNVFLEWRIPKTNVIDKTGGRIDIFIDDGKNSISIENKIFAGDQEAQIERYCNYLKGRNTVYYLTLNGTEPTDLSKGKLTLDSDYHLLSYKTDIRNWLKECMKEAVEFPILRESIKQYINLINKLTGQLIENQMEEELKKEILKHFESAKIIYENFPNILISLQDDFREGVKNHIESKYSNFKVEKNKKSTDIVCLFLKQNSKVVKIGIESFNGKNHMVSLKIGFWLNWNKINKEQIERYMKQKGFKKLSPFWYNTRELGFNFNDFSNVIKLNDENQGKEILNSVCENIDLYVKEFLPDFNDLEEFILKIKSFDEITT